MSERSELEMVVIGIVWKRGSCTAYAILKEFVESPSSHFSGSAGAVYPLVERLTKDGLLIQEREKRGKRSRSVYKTSRSGLARLRRWLAPPMSDDAVMANYDSIRTRMYFLSALKPDQQIEFLEDAQLKLREQIKYHNELIQKYDDADDLFSRLAAEGFLDSIKSRMRWLARVQVELNSKYEQ